MVEEVQTGGLQTFSYKKGYHPKASQEDKDEIEEAYQRAYERKKKEKKRKTLIWTIIIIAILLILSGLIWYLNSK
jgi:cytoskeletal protein RodZ